MYSTRLGKLKEYNIKPESIEKLGKCLKEVGEKGITRFSPRYVADYIGLNQEDTNKILLRAVQVGIIHIYYEIECPQGDSDFYVTELKDVDWDVEHNCRVCGTTYTPSPNHVWVTFGTRSAPIPKA